MKDTSNPTYSITDRLYFGEFAIYKHTITAHFEHPLLKKNVCHKFHLGTLERHKDPAQFKKRVKDFGWMIDKTDRTEELQLFNVPLKDRQNYFFFEIYDGKKKLPLYYASMYTRDCYPDLDHKMSREEVQDIPRVKYIHDCERELSFCIYEEAMHPSCMMDLFSFFHEYGFYFFEALNVDSPEYEDEPEDPKWLDKYRRSFKKMKEPAMRNYALAVLDSVYQRANDRKEVIQCQLCDRYIDYVRNKRFCSPISEKRDCAKKARNKRFYKKNREAILPKARKSTREQRETYKKYGVKK